MTVVDMRHQSAVSEWCPKQKNCYYKNTAPSPFLLSCIGFFPTFSLWSVYVKLPISPKHFSPQIQPEMKTDNVHLVPQIRAIVSQGM
ncbi:hypothetical protein CPC08DRAFT_711830 [Agrocybe pediades]|nr:hypothetical protein CPC08DRAFT_711830 [Agrocybe pediades]